MIDVTTRNLAEVTEFLKNAPEEMYEGAKRELSRSALVVESETKENATNDLTVRSGNLRRSIMSEVSGTTLSTLFATTYSASVVDGAPIAYARIHEEGGRIKKKNAYKKVPGGPYLNIPSQQNKTPAGVMRLSAKSVFQAGGHIQGRVVYLGTVPMFFLVKSVRIPARLGMEKAFDREIPTLLSRLKDIL